MDGLGQFPGFNQNFQTNFGNGFNTNIPSFTPLSGVNGPQPYQAANYYTSMLSALSSAAFMMPMPELSPSFTITSMPQCWPPISPAVKAR